MMRRGIRRNRLLWAYRRQQEWSVSEMARRIGVSAAFYGAVERQEMPSLRYVGEVRWGLNAIARYFGLPFARLFSAAYLARLDQRYTFPGGPPPVWDLSDVPFAQDTPDLPSVPSAEEVFLASPAALRPEIDRMLFSLTDQQARVLAWRYGLIDGEEHTLAAIGKLEGLSPERVRQREAMALARCRTYYVRALHAVWDSREKHGWTRTYEIE